MTRQRAWQLRKKAEGLCTACGGERQPGAETLQCEPCRLRQNMKMRERQRRNREASKDG